MRCPDCNKFVKVEYEGEDAEVNGIEFSRNYTGHGGDRVLFVKVVDG